MRAFYKRILKGRSRIIESEQEDERSLVANDYAEASDEDAFA